VMCESELVVVGFFAGSHAPTIHCCHPVTLSRSAYDSK
jgi:hypothetical protein